MLANVGLAFFDFFELDGHFWNPKTVFGPVSFAAFSKIILQVGIVNWGYGRGNGVGPHVQYCSENTYYFKDSLLSFHGRRIFHMASKKTVKPALDQKPYTKLKVNTGTVKPALKQKDAERGKKNRGTVKRALQAK